MPKDSPKISKKVFVNILQDKTLVQDDELLIFQTLYSLQRQEASATDLAIILGWTDKAAVVGKIAGLGMRIKKKFDIQQGEREDGTKSYWDFFFTGYSRGTFFIYQLRQELKEALEDCGLARNLNILSLQKAYLFAWNPDNWYQWNDPNNVPYIEQNIEDIQRTGKATLNYFLELFLAFDLYFSIF